MFLNGDAIPTPDAFGGRVVDDSFLSCSTPASSTCRGRCPARPGAGGRSSSTPPSSRRWHRRRARPTCSTSSPVRCSSSWPLRSRPPGLPTVITTVDALRRRGSWASRRSTGTSRAPSRVRRVDARRRRLLEADSRRRPAPAPRSSSASGHDACRGVDGSELRWPTAPRIDVAVATTARRRSPPACRSAATASADRRRRRGGHRVVAAPTMPRDAALAGAAGLFAPGLRALGARCPAAVFCHLPRWPSAARVGVDVLVDAAVVRRLLDEPFDPSPYAPVSRQHWNEVYLDDSPRPAATAAGGRRRADRLAVLADAAARPAARPSPPNGRGSRGGSPRSSPSARRRATPFRAERPDRPTPAPARARRASHHLAQFLAHGQLAGDRGPTAAPSLALDLPIGGHPDGYEMWAHPELFAPDDVGRRAARRVLRRGSGLGLPAALPGAGRRSGLRLWRTLVARRRRARLDVADRPRDGRPPAVVDPARRRPATACMCATREELLAVIAAEARARHHDRRRGPRHRARGGLRRARPLGGDRHVRGAVPPRPRPPPAVPARSSPGPDPRHAAVRRRRRGDARHAGGTATGVEASSAVERAPTPRGSSTPRRAARPQRRYARRRRPRRPRRRDGAAQRPRQVLPDDWRRRLPAPTSEVLADPTVRPPTWHARRRAGDDAWPRPRQPARGDRPPPLQRGHATATCTDARRASRPATACWFTVWAPVAAASPSSATSTGGRRACRWRRSAVRDSGRAPSTAPSSASRYRYVDHDPHGDRVEKADPVPRRTTNRRRRRR